MFIQVSSRYYRLLQISTGYYILLQKKQFSARYSLTISRGCSFKDYLVINSTKIHWVVLRKGSKAIWRGLEATAIRRILENDVQRAFLSHIVSWYISCMLLTILGHCLSAECVGKHKGESTMFTYIGPSGCTITILLFCQRMAWKSCKTQKSDVCLMIEGVSPFFNIGYQDYIRPDFTYWPTVKGTPPQKLFFS